MQEASQDSSVLFSSILQEAAAAKQDTMWSPFQTLLPTEMQKVCVSPDSPYLFITSFGEAHKQTSVRSPRGQRGRQPKQITSTPSTPQPKSVAPKQESPKKQEDIVPEHPQKTIMHEEDGESWTLRCVCNLVSGAGLLVRCEKCGCWQHAICMGLNNHTIPERYLCDICSERRIRCKCGDNLNYKLPIIQCTQCGLYVHKKCEGVGPGAMPKGNFVCHFCGKSDLHFEKPILPPDAPLDDSRTVTFTQELIDGLTEELLVGPFAEFIKEDIADTSLNSRDFCEQLYDKLRAFFFVAHQKYQSTCSKKKRNRLAANFFHACQYLGRTLYNIPDNNFVKIIDTLIYNDIYHKPLFGEPETDLQFTEYVQAAFTTVTPMSVMPKEVNLTVNKAGKVIASVDLIADQFICFINDGLVGHINEYNITDKVDSSYYAMHDAPFVLDESHAPDSILNKLPRSSNGNCGIKLFMVNNTIMCGLFATKSHLFITPDDDVHSIPAKTPLTLGFDWIPAVLDDVSKSLSWQFYGDEDSDSSPPPTHHRIVRESLHEIYSAAARHQNSIEKVKKRQKVEEPKKKKRGRSKKTAAPVTTEMTLFPMMLNDDPGEFLFSIVNEYEAIESNCVAATVCTPTKHYQPRTKASTAIAETPIKQKPAHTYENSAVDSDDSGTFDEAYEDPDNDDFEKSYMAEKSEERVPHRGRPRKNENYLSGKKEEKHKKHRGRKKKVVPVTKTEEEEEKVEKEEEKEELPPKEEEEPVKKEDKEEEQKAEEEEETKEEEIEHEESEAEEKETTNKKEKGNKEVQPIFSNEKMEEITVGMKQISYKGMRMRNPSQDIMSILGM